MDTFYCFCKNVVSSNSAAGATFLTNLEMWLLDNYSGEYQTWRGRERERESNGREKESERERERERVIIII